MKRPELKESKLVGNMSLAGASIDYQMHLQKMNKYIDHLEAQIKSQKSDSLPPVSKSVCECKDEWLVDVRLNVMRCKKCGQEF